MDKLLLIIVLLSTLIAVSQTSVINRVKRDFENKQIDDVIAMLGPRVEVDIVLIVDRSRGMSMDNFYHKEKRILERILRQYATLSTDYARVAGVTFAIDVEVAFDYVSSYTDESCNKARLFSGNDPLWDSMMFYYDEARSTDTNVKLGLDEAARILEEGRRIRPGVSQVILLSTDGDFENYDETVAVAEQLKNDDVVIFAIGVGPWIADNRGNVAALTTQDGYFADYAIWQSMTQAEGLLSNYAPDITPDLELAELLPTAEGFCGGACREHSQCYVDIDMGTETCMCSRGYFLTTNDSGVEICEPCRIHYYKSSYGNQECRVCPPPMYTNNTGNTDISACICPRDVVSVSEEHLDCTDQCSGICGMNQKCDYTGTRTWLCLCEDTWENTVPGNIDAHTCDLSRDDCSSRPCNNGGQCVDLNGAYMCVCMNGYTGSDCDSILDPCVTGLCINGGNCTSSGMNDWECDCPYGWGGTFCALVETTTSSTTAMSTEAPTTTTTPKSEQRKDPKDDPPYIIIGAAGGGGLLLLIIIIIIACCCCRRRREEPAKEVEANGNADGSRLYRKNQNAKTFSNRFSDFWRKKTMTPGSFAGEGVKGLPSVPPRRRPDLLGHVDEDGFATTQSDHEMEYAVFDNQTVQDTGGMEGWQRYVTDISNSGLVVKASIVKIKGKRRALSEEWDWEDSEIDKLLIIMENSDYNVPALIQSDEYHIHSNDGTVASGKTIGSSEEPRVICIGKTEDFMIIGIANGNKDSGQCLKEVQWITDHIKNEGY